MDIPSQEQLVAKIDTFLERRGMAPSRLGREVTGESNFVTMIREGREPNLGTLRKLFAFMEEKDAEVSEGSSGSISEDGRPEARSLHRLSTEAR